MHARPGPALAALALLAAGCSGGTAPPPTLELFAVEPGSPELLAGGWVEVALVTRASGTGACPAGQSPAIERAGGGALPAGITLEIVPMLPATCRAGAASKDPPPECHLLLTYRLAAAAGTPVARHDLQARLDWCGLSATAPFALAVVPGPDRAFCGISTRDPCAGDADCGRTGCSGQVCAAMTAPVITTCDFADCYDPAPSGAACGCGAGACRWR